MGRFYRYQDQRSRLIRNLDGPAAHNFLCHPNGEECPDGCDSLAKTDRLALYVKAFEEIPEEPLTDEFLIEAEGNDLPIRRWTRSKLETSKFIAERAVNGLGYKSAKVYNIFGGTRSDALYEATPNEQVQDSG